VVPDRFRAVGQVYADFHQVDDDEVREALATAS
jgi:predicted phosphoribosyltransferase